MKRRNTSEDLCLPSLSTAKRRRFDLSQSVYGLCSSNGHKPHHTLEKLSFSFENRIPQVHNIMMLPKEMLCSIFAFFNVKELFLYAFFFLFCLSLTLKKLHFPEHIIFFLFGPFYQQKFLTSLLPGKLKIKFLRLRLKPHCQ
jgi:hypothetical protein